MDMKEGQLKIEKIETVLDPNKIMPILCISVFAALCSFIGSDDPFTISNFIKAYLYTTLTSVLCLGLIFLTFLVLGLFGLLILDLVFGLFGLSVKDKIKDKKKLGDLLLSGALLSGVFIVSPVLSVLKSTAFVDLLIEKFFALRLVAFANPLIKKYLYGVAIYAVALLRGIFRELTTASKIAVVIIIICIYMEYEL